MKIIQTVVFTKRELENIINGEIYAFVNPGDDREILLMTGDTYSKWKEGETDESMD